MNSNASTPGGTIERTREKEIPSKKAYHKSKKEKQSSADRLINQAIDDQTR